MAVQSCELMTVDISVALLLARSGHTTACRRGSPQVNILQVGLHPSSTKPSNVTSYSWNEWSSYYIFVYKVSGGNFFIVIYN